MNACQYDALKQTFFQIGRSESNFIPLRRTISRHSHHRYWGIYRTGAPTFVFLYHSNLSMKFQQSVQSTDQKKANHRNAIRRIMLMNYVIRDCTNFPFICRWAGVLVQNSMNYLQCRCPLHRNISLLQVLWKCPSLPPSVHAFPRTHLPAS